MDKLELAMDSFFFKPRFEGIGMDVNKQWRTVPDVSAAVRLVLCGELGKQAVVAGTETPQYRE